MFRCCCKIRSLASRLSLEPEASCSGGIFVLGAHHRCSGAKPLSLAKNGLHPLIGLRLMHGLGYAPWMALDFAECDRARVARDPKYDGRFYTGVRTTGIYCRPVCPVRPARSVNVTFFPSA